MKTRGFEVVKEYVDKGINLPVRKTKNSAAYDIEAAEEVILPSFKKGMKPTLIPTGLKAYMQSDEVLLIVPRSSGPKKQGISFPHNVGVIDSDYYNNPDNEGHIFAKITNASLDGKTLHLKQGDAFMQGVFLPFGICDDDDASAVRTGGFGSTSKQSS